MKTTITVNSLAEFIKVEKFARNKVDVANLEMSFPNQVTIEVDQEVGPELTFDEFEQLFL